MIIELTVAQADALDDALFADDDALREFPIPLIGDLGVLTDERDNIIGYVMAHEDLTFEDEVVLHALLDDRVAELGTIRRLPSADRPAARAAIRTGLRQDARKNARIDARIDTRVAGRVAARVEMRLDIRKGERIARLIEERKREIDSSVSD